jgi:glucans biosynthesis protein
LQAKGEHTFTYRLHWGPDAPKSSALARFSRTAIGAKGGDNRIFVLDLIGDRFKSVDPNSVRGNVSGEKIEIKNIVTQPNPAIGGWRLNFEVSVKEKAPIELRASLMQGNDAISEVWVYRWTP